MAESTSTTTAEESEPVTATEKRRVVIGRVLNLSIFFVGVGVFAAAGFVLAQGGLFASYQLTYFSVGAAIGVVGLLLWLLTR